jgi:hypothetical protein
VGKGSGQRRGPGRDIGLGLGRKGDRQIAIPEGGFELARGEPAAGRFQRGVSDSPEFGTPGRRMPRFKAFVCLAQQTVLA